MKNSQCGFSHFVQEEVYIMAEKRTIESLIEQGKSSGKLSTKEITDVLEDLEYDVDQMESFYESCSNNNIEIIDDFSLENFDEDIPLGEDKY